MDKRVDQIASLLDAVKNHAPSDVRDRVLLQAGMIESEFEELCIFMQDEDVKFFDDEAYINDFEGKIEQYLENDLKGADKDYILGYLKLVLNAVDDLKVDELNDALREAEIKDIVAISKKVLFQIETGVERVVDILESLK